MGAPSSQPSEAEGMEMFYKALAEAIVGNAQVKAALAAAVISSPVKEAVQFVALEVCEPKGGIL